MVPSDRQDQHETTKTRNEGAKCGEIRDYKLMALETFNLSSLSLSHVFMYFFLDFQLVYLSKSSPEIPAALAAEAPPFLKLWQSSTKSDKVA